MGATYLGVVASGTSITTDPTVATVTKDVPAGTLVVASFVSVADNSTAICTDNKGNTYTLRIVSGLTATTPPVAVAFFESILTAPLAAGDTLTVDTGGTARKALAVEAWTGLGAPDRAIGATGKNSTFTIGPTADLAESGELVILAVGTAQGAATSAPTGVTGYTMGADVRTNGGTNERSITTFYKIAPDTAGVSASGTLTVSQSYAATLITHKVAGAAPGGPPPPDMPVLTMLPL